MKVIIAGSRTIQDYTLVLNAIKASGYEIDELVSGGARGVDSMGETWAYAHNVPIKQFPAEWDKYGKSAGFRRNEVMAKYADALILVWDGQSHGSAHMLKTARAQCLIVFECAFSRGLVTTHRYK